MKNIRVFYLNIFQFLEVKFSMYLNRRVFVISYDVSICDLLFTFLAHQVSFENESILKDLVSRGTASSFLEWVPIQNDAHNLYSFKPSVQ